MAIRSKNTIFNAALLRCGREDTPTGGSGDLWRTMDANYDEIVRAAFEDGDGNLPFGKGRKILTSRNVGSGDYDDSYALPDDCLHVIEVWLGDYPDAYTASDILEPWEMMEGRLLIDADGRTVEIEYVRAGQEALWSANFSLGVQRKLEAVIQMFLEEPDEAELREAQADMFFLKAGVKAAKGRSQRPVWKRGGGRLVRARRAIRSRR